MMRRSMAPALFAAAAAALLAALAPAFASAETSFGVGGTYSSFSSDSTREKGSQLFTPIDLTVESKNGFFGGLSGGYVVSHYRPPTPGAADVDVSTLVDTHLSLFYTKSFRYGCVRLGSGFNLPTGTSTLTPQERRAEIDPDYAELVPVGSFGEGTNANPGFALTLPLGRLTLGLGASYHFRGPYDPTADVENDEIDPGDEAVGKLAVEWRGKTLRLRGGLRYQYTTPDSVGGVETVQEGSLLAGNAIVEYRTGPWFLTFQGSYSGWNHGEVLGENGALQREEYLRFGDEVHLKAMAQYRLSKSTLLSGTVRGHFVQPNGYPVDSALYDSGRTALELGAGLWYQLFPGIYLNAALSYQWVSEPADGEQPVDTTYGGVKSSLNVVTWFNREKEK